MILEVGKIIRDLFRKMKSVERMRQAIPLFIKLETYKTSVPIKTGMTPPPQ